MRTFWRSAGCLWFCDWWHDELRDIQLDHFLHLAWASEKWLRCLNSSCLDRQNPSLDSVHRWLWSTLHWDFSGKLIILSCLYTSQSACHCPLPLAMSQNQLGKYMPILISVWEKSIRWISLLGFRGRVGLRHVMNSRVPLGLSRGFNKLPCLFSMTVDNQMDLI